MTGTVCDPTALPTVFGVGGAGGVGVGAGFCVTVDATTVKDTFANAGTLLRPDAVELWMAPRALVTEFAMAATVPVRTVTTLLDIIWGLACSCRFACASSELKSRRGEQLPPPLLVTLTSDSSTPSTLSAIAFFWAFFTSWLFFIASTVVQESAVVVVSNDTVLWEPEVAWVPLDIA